MLTQGVDSSAGASIAGAVAALVSLESRATDASCFHLVVASMHSLCAAIVEAERHGLAREEILAALAPARRIHARSPFVKRLQTWPRGYPGDFETIEYLLDQRNRARPGTLAHSIERYALGCMAAQQHRNKVALQAAFIRSALCDQVRPVNGGRPTAPRVLMIACGGAPEIRGHRELLEVAAAYTLCDSDTDALAYCRKTLGALGLQCRFVAGNVFHRLRELKRMGPFDVIVTGGLYDYLTDRQAETLTRHAYNDLLADDGRMLFTNICAGNPYRVWMEYLADWQLRERSEDDLRSLARSAGIAESQCELATDGTGLALIARIRKVAPPSVHLDSRRGAERALHVASADR